MTDTVEQVEALTDAAAASPQTQSADGVSVTEQPLQDLIALEKHRANTAAAQNRNNRLGIGFFQLKPPGAT